MNITGLFNLSWQRYLNLLFLLLTVGFLTSGVVTLIAANLDYFSDLAKIYGLQTLLVVTVVLGIYCFVSESRRQAKEKLKWKTYSLFCCFSLDWRFICLSRPNLSNGGRCMAVICCLDTLPTSIFIIISECGLSVTICRYCQCCVLFI